MHQIAEDPSHKYLRVFYMTDKFIIDMKNIIWLVSLSHKMILVMQYNFL